MPSSEMFVDDAARRLGPDHDAAPDRLDHVVALLLEGGDVGEIFAALRGADAEQPDVAVPDLRRRGARRHDGDVEVAAEQGEAGLLAALEGNPHRFELAFLLQPIEHELLKAGGRKPADVEAVRAGAQE